jgi:WD40 repeat protein
MRHTFLSLIVALVAAIACFVLLPVIVTWFGFEVDTFTWIFIEPLLFVLLLAITITVGFVAFLVSKAKLPDRGWRSAQTFVILLTFAATVAAAALITWPFFITIEPPELGPQQAGLPNLHLAQTLKAEGNRSGTWELAWSTDGERLASYGETGISAWSPDGKYQTTFRIYQNSVTWDVLHYLSGHRLLITSPFSEANSAEERDSLNNIAFSVVDAETGKVVQNIPGPHLGGGVPKNGAIDLAVSPDERLVAVICSHIEPQINVYSTDNWQKVMTIDFRAGETGNARDPRVLAFSPDGATLAVIGFSNRIKFFKTESWAPSGSLLTYPDPSPLLGTLAFSPDGTMIAVGSSTGGSRWIYPNSLIRLPGSGSRKVEFPADPLRVYRVSDGKLIASLGSFPGGLSRHGLVWSPNGEYLAFQDGRGDIRFWNPFRTGLSVNVARQSKTYSNLLFSKGGSQLAANFSDGLKVFDVVPPR